MKNLKQFLLFCVFLSEDSAKVRLFQGTARNNNIKCNKNTYFLIYVKTY